MAEFNVAPAIKKQKIDNLNSNICIFCDKIFTKRNPAVNPDLAKLDCLFVACRERCDDLAQALLPNEQEIKSGAIAIKYHRNCRSSYTSKQHIHTTVRDRPVNQETSSSTASNESCDNPDKTFTRSKTILQDFDWKNNCFICSEVCSEKKRSSWSKVESLPNNDSEQDIYTTVLNAAYQRHDKVIITRLLGIANSDLVAVEARYHRVKGCIVSYLNPRNIISKQGQYIESAHSDALHTLIDEYEAPITRDKQVFTLSTLTKRYNELLNDLGIHSDNYTSQNLKQKLKKISPNWVFFPQPGLSDLVCSKFVSVDEMLLKVQELSETLTEISYDTNIEDDELYSTNSTGSCGKESDEVIIHRAIGILRRTFLQTEEPTDEYYSSNEMTVEAQKAFLHPLLLKAIGWLVSDKHFSDATETDDPKCVNIACDITTLATSKLSPKHVGLAVHFNHEFGSRKLIEDLYAMGYCMSYDELRRFLTSAATYVTTNQAHTASGAIIPPELIPKASGGKQVVCVADNWDHNEKTVDGKRTTHAMTSILVSPEVPHVEIEEPRIKKIASRVFNPSSLPGMCSL